MASDSPDKASYVYNSQLDAFTLYHISNDTHHQSAIGPALPALGHAMSGAAGTAIAKLVTYPLDLVITRLQVQRQLKRNGKHAHYTGILDAIETIYEREGGLQAFYSGVVPEVVKGVADSFLFFLAYSYVRQSRLNARDSGKSLPALEEIGVGMVAGAFSKFWTTPLQQIVTRKQTAAMLHNDPQTAPISKTAEIARGIMREKGLQGFWSGYSASLVLTLNPSITMLLHKILLSLLVPRAKRNDPGARITFLVAAVSKVLASTVTYPFSLAKTRAQVSWQKPNSASGETSETDKAGEDRDSTAARARQRTVFSTILRIAETEGIWGLYQGLGAEVLKGFFSHGITMLMKDRIHAAIISLYYAVLKAMQKFPSPDELAKRASDEAKELYDHSKEQVGEAYTKGVEIAGQASEKVKEVVAVGSQQASHLIENGKQHASDAYAKGAQLSELASAKIQEAATAGSSKAGEFLDQTREAASDAYAKGAQLAESASAKVQEATTTGSSKAGEVFGQTREAASDASERAVGAAETGGDAAANVGQRVRKSVKDADVKDADVKDIDGPDTGIKE